MSVSILNKVSLTLNYEDSCYIFSNLLFQLLNFGFQLLLGILYERKVADSFFQFCVFISQALEFSFMFYSFCDFDGLVLNGCALSDGKYNTVQDTNNCSLEERVWIGCLRENFIDMEKGVVRGLGAFCKTINFGLIR
jgi:hypothetical protein